MKKYIILLLLFTVVPLKAQGLIELFYNALSNSAGTGNTIFSKNQDCSIEEYKYLNGGYFKAQELGLDLKEGYKAIQVYKTEDHANFFGIKGTEKAQVVLIIRKNGSPVGYAYEYISHWSSKKYYLGVPLMLSENYPEKLEVMKMYEESMIKAIYTDQISIKPLLLVLTNPFSKESPASKDLEVQF